MKKSILLLLFVVSLILSACQTPTENIENFLSITVTTYNDAETLESGMVTTVYSLGLENNEIENKWSFERSAQYPLAVYSKYDNSVYYTQRVDNDVSGKGDQLFSKSLTTGETLQLSEDMFGINYIVPLNADQIVYVAAKKQSRILSVFLYDKNTDSTTMANLPKDMSIQLLSYNAFTGKLIGSGRFENEELAAAEVSNQGKGQRFIPPNHYIFDFTEFNDVKLLYKTENMLIQRLASDSDNNILFTQADTYRGWEPEFYTYHYNVKKNKLKPLENLDASLYISEFLYCADDNLYFIGVDEFNEEQNPRGIYSYNLSTKEIKLIFTSEDGWINNFCLF